MMEDTQGTRLDALARALSLLDSLAGQGAGHIDASGQDLMADDVCSQLAEAFCVPLEPGWARQVAAIATNPAAEVARMRAAVKSVDTYYLTQPGCRFPVPCEIKREYLAAIALPLTLTGEADCG